ncbi:DUF4236 domain-containing protein [Acinetobacter pittii]|uniref:DUF4236 domain-containing protein n=1 Tax=Acinetobacter pittii TaxID=48296 RepID=UPI00062A7011|nr:DUF4236 domain-containing protein [Acinetobacter pittii]
MGLNFRKSLKIAPGVRLNITKKGVSSVSLGAKGARINVGKKGTKTTIGVPSTGLTYSNLNPKKTKEETAKRETVNSGIRSNMTPLRSQVLPVSFLSKSERKVSILLGIGIVMMPYIFAWFTLREGYSKGARFISFGWFLVLIVISRQS